MIIWECLSEECRRRLDTWQIEHYGEGLIIVAPEHSLEVEPLEEIDRLMRQPPHPIRPGVLSK